MERDKLERERENKRKREKKRESYSEIKNGVREEAVRRK